MFIELRTCEEHRNLRAPDFSHNNLVNEIFVKPH